MTLKELKAINTLLASSARKFISFLTEQRDLSLTLLLSSEQDQRDKGLQRLHTALVKEGRWVEAPEQKHLRVIWEGLFFSKCAILCLC